MALPWPHGTPTLPRSVRAAIPAATSRAVSTRLRESAAGSPIVARAVALATAPLTALVAMLVGLALLFVLPPVGLPFVALVVLPAVVFHLRAERRTALRRPRA